MLSVRLYCGYSYKEIKLDVYVSYLPELDKVLQRCAGHVDTICQRVQQKQQKELVVGITNTVVDPAEISHQFYTVCVMSSHLAVFRLNHVGWFSHGLVPPFFRAENL